MEKPTQRAVSAIPEGIKAMTAGATADIKADKEFMASISQSVAKQIKTTRELQMSPLFQRLIAPAQFSAVQAALQDEQVQRKVLNVVQLNPDVLPAIIAASEFRETFDTLSASEQDEVADAIKKATLNDDAGIIASQSNISPKIKPVYESFIYRLKAVNGATLKDLAGIIGFSYSIFQGDVVVGTITLLLHTGGMIVDRFWKGAAK